MSNKFNIKRMSVALMAVFTLAMQTLSAQTYERTYLTTDKHCYVAGDRIWCSAFCWDAVSGGLSDQSAVAYAELLSSQGMAVSAKIALVGGRGSGYIDIPESLPTGNYRLIAYTAVNKNEKGYDYLSNARTISVFNTGSTDRVKDGVKVLGLEEYMELQDSAKTPVYDSPSVISVDVPLIVRKSDTLRLKLDNVASRAASMSISIFHDDGILDPENGNITTLDRKAPANREYEEKTLPEYDGEILYADVQGPDSLLAFNEDTDITGYISTIGTSNDTYTSLISSRTGDMVFKTYNIYGNKDMVCELDGMDSDVDAHIVLRSPFVDIAPADIPALQISKVISRQLAARTDAMHVYRKYCTDTLMEFLPRKEQILFRADNCKRYVLDDYDRFPTVSEVLVEIIPELRARGRKNKVHIQVLSMGEGEQTTVEWKNSLVLMDGVPIFQHKKIMDFDAMLIKEVDVWPYQVFMGNRAYSGVADFRTSNGNITYIDFGSNVRITDFKGASYPMALTLRHNPEGMYDIRQTAYWQPLVDLEPGRSTEVECLMPDYEGKFRMVIQGVLDDGTPFCRNAVFVSE